MNGIIVTWSEEECKFITKRGSIGFEDGLIKEVNIAFSDKAVAKGVIFPRFINAHTHLGDAVVKGLVSGSIEELFAPPHGIKFQALESVGENEIVNAMSRSIDDMIELGIGHFSDFREGGIKGVEQLMKALKDTVGCTLLGRPSSLSYDRGEVEQILSNADGIGVSSVSDWDYDELRRVARHAKGKGKMFALHASERLREDIDLILGLEPDFLVHMVHATESDLQRVADVDVPVVLCLRTNMFFGNLPNLASMLFKGIRVALGTDNAMINSPNILRELEFAFRVMRMQGVEREEILKLITVNPKKILNAKYSMSLDVEETAEFVVVSVPYENPTKALIHATAKDILLISTGKGFMIKEKIEWKR